MGRKMGSDKSTSRGVELRKGPNSEAIRIRFMYRGMECRETLKLAHTKANIKYAERLRGEILNAIERGAFDYAKTFPGSRNLAKLGAQPIQMTIGALIDAQLAIGGRSLEASTLAAYKSSHKAHLEPQWGNTPVKELTPKMLRDWILTLTSKARSIRQMLIPLRGALDQAVDDGMIEFNPLDKIKLAKLLEREAKSVEFVADPFSAAEIAAILMACDGQERNVWQFAFATGLRPSEYIALKWGSVDWLTGGVMVERARVVSSTKDRTKTPAGRRLVDLRTGAHDALMAQKRYTALAGELVFHDPDYGKGWEGTHRLRCRWQSILRRAGVRYRNPYQTRHTFASTLLSSGENPLYVAKQMGHKNTQMITDTYGKWIEQEGGVLPEFYRRVEVAAKAVNNN